MHEVVESILVVGSSLVNELLKSKRVEILKMLRLRHVNVRIEVVMTQKLILVLQCSDEMGASDGGCLRHERSMARIGADCKRWWTVYWTGT